MAKEALPLVQRKIKALSQDQKAFGNQRSYVSQKSAPPEAVKQEKFKSQQ